MTKDLTLSRQNLTTDFHRSTGDFTDEEITWLRQPGVLEEVMRAALDSRKTGQFVRMRPNTDAEIANGLPTRMPSNHGPYHTDLLLAGRVYEQLLDYAVDVTHEDDEDTLKRIIECSGIDYETSNFPMESLTPDLLLHVSARMRLLCFDGYVSLDQVCCAMEYKGLQPAHTGHLIAFGRAHRSIALQHRIIAPGGGHRYTESEGVKSIQLPRLRPSNLFSKNLVLDGEACWPRHERDGTCLRDDVFLAVVPN